MARDTPINTHRMHEMKRTPRKVDDMNKPGLFTRALHRIMPVSAAISSPEIWGSSLHLDIVRELYGLADSSNITIDRKAALELSVVAKAHRQLITNIPRMRLVSRKGMLATAVQMPYLAQLEADRPTASTLIDLSSDLFFYGVGWLIVTRRDAAGWPARGGFRYLPRDQATIDSDGKLTHAWGEPINPRNVKEFSTETFGLLGDHQRVLRRAAVIAKAASQAEANPVPSIILKNTGSEKLTGNQIEELLSSWVRNRQRRAVGYADRTIDVVPLSQQDAQLLIDGQKRVDLEVARACGAPAWAADVVLEGTSMNYQNRQSRSWELIDLFLASFMTAITSRLSMPDMTPLGWRIEFNTDDLTRDDMKTRFETYAIGLSNGFIDQAWIEAQEGEPLKIGSNA